MPLQRSSPVGGQDEEVRRRESASQHFSISDYGIPQYLGRSCNGTAWIIPLLLRFSFLHFFQQIQFFCSVSQWSFVLFVCAAHVHVVCRCFFCRGYSKAFSVLLLSWPSSREPHFKCELFSIPSLCISLFSPFSWESRRVFGSSRKSPQGPARAREAPGLRRICS